MSDKDVYRQALTPLTADNETLSRLQARLEKKKSPLRFRRLALTLACIGAVITLPVAANAISGGRLLEQVQELISGMTGAEIWVSPGQENEDWLAPGRGVTFLDESFAGPLPVGGYIDKKGQYIVVQAGDGTRTAGNITGELLAGETVEITGIYEGLAYCYRVYMKDGKAAVENQDTGEITSYFEEDK